MTKRNKKKNKGIDRKTSKEGRALPSIQPDKRIKSTRYLVWSIGVLIVVIAVVSAWAIFWKAPQDSSVTSSTDDLRAEASIPNTDAAGSVVSGGPQISFPEAEFDLGTIAQGTKASHTFVVKNIGDAPLKLIKAQGT